VSTAAVSTPVNTEVKAGALPDRLPPTQTAAPVQRWTLPGRRPA